MSVQGNPACPDADTAEKAVNEVWESCFSDTRPFDEVRIIADSSRTITSLIGLADILDV